MARFMRRFDLRTRGLVQMPEVQRPQAIARARGLPSEIDSRAFSFAPANDLAEDAVVERVTRHGQHALANPMTGLLPLGMDASAAAFRFWSLANRIAFESWSRIAGPTLLPVAMPAAARVH